MNFKIKKILGINITVSSKREDLEEIWKYLKKSPKSKVQSQKKGIKPFIIFTPNPEIITYAQKDEEFARIVNTAQINLPDGVGVVWAIKKLHGMEIAQIAGVDFMLELVKMARVQGFRIGLIGGRGGIALATAECLQKNHPKLASWAMDGPEIEIQNSELRIQNQKENLQKIIKKITEENTDILFVAFGFPKQEYFIDCMRYYLSSINYDKPLVLMAVGGSFDYISGKIKRAPQWMRNLGLEWLFRLIMEPWRLPRQLKGAAFFYKVLSAH